MDDEFLRRIWTFGEMIVQNRPADWAAVHVLAKTYQADVEARGLSDDIKAAGDVTTKRNTSTYYNPADELLIAKAIRLGADFYEKIGVQHDLAHLPVIAEAAYRAITIGTLLQKFVTGVREGLDSGRCLELLIARDMQDIASHITAQTLSPFQMQSAGDVIVEELTRLLNPAPDTLGIEIQKLFGIGTRIGGASYHAPPALLS